MSEIATSATTIVRRTPSRDDDPRLARFSAFDSRPVDICSDGSRPTIRETVTAAKAAKPSARGSKVTDAVGGNEGPINGTAV
jgi:hypothetical protein